MALAAHAGAPPGYYRIMVGDFEVTALYDGGFGLDAASLQGNVQPTPGPVAGFLVNTGSKRILIDTGTGGHSGGPGSGKLMRNLKASGYRASQIDLVLLTRLQADHVGGLYDRKGRRVFRRAEIRMMAADSDFWLSSESVSRAPPEAHVYFRIARDAAMPYVAAGKWRPFHTMDELVPGVRPYAMSDDAPGLVGYEIRSRGESLLVVSDITKLHTPPSRTLIAAAHMPFPSLGHLRKDDSRYVWVPVVFKPGAAAP